jgi:hypothetical protein
MFDHHKSYPGGGMEKSMSGPLQSPGRYKAFRPSSAHPPSQRPVGHRGRPDGSSENANVNAVQNRAKHLRQTYAP